MWKTDSRSIVDAVAAGPFAQRELFAASVWAAVDLVALGARVAIVHILSHASDAKNEMADRDASNQGLDRDCATEGYPLRRLTGHPTWREGSVTSPRPSGRWSTPMTDATSTVTQRR